jgi:hypothetical protein
MKGKVMKNDNAERSIPNEVITYAAGSIESKLAQIARDTNQPEQELREWVAIFLLSSWEGLSNSLPTLRGKTAKIYPTTRAMAMVNNSHPKPSKKPSDSSDHVKGKGLRKGFKFKPGTHWTQKPENKARLSKVVKQAHAARKVA